MANVTHDLTREVSFGSEDATGNQIALDFGEPDFDLIKPGGIGRSKVKVHIGVVAQEGCDSLSFVSREIVSNDMNLLAWSHTGDQFIQKGDKLCAGMAAGGLANDFSGGGV